MATSKKADLGKDTEETVRDWLESKSCAVAGFAYHRLPDARSAQGALAAQPSDFIVGYRGTCTWLEAKETAELNVLPKTKIRQYPKLKLFDMAGHSVRVLVFRSALNDWVILTGRDLFDHDECPKSFSLKVKPTYESADAALKEMFT